MEFATCNLLWRVFTSRASLYSKIIIWGGRGVKNDKVLFQRIRISSAFPMLLHQPFCMKDDQSPSRYAVTSMCYYFPVTCLFFIPFILWGYKSSFKPHVSHWFLNSMNALTCSGIFKVLNYT